MSTLDLPGDSTSIRYTGNWANADPPPGSGRNSKRTSQRGAMARIDFSASVVYVVGDLPPRSTSVPDPRSRYTLTANGEAVKVEVFEPSTRRSTTQWEHEVDFFSHSFSSWVVNASLVIENLVEGGILSLNTLGLEGLGEEPLPEVLTSRSGSQSTSLPIGSTRPTGLDSPSSSDGSIPTVTSSESTSGSGVLLSRSELAGAIVGSIFGTVLLTVLAACFFLWLRRRKGSQDSPSDRRPSSLVGDPADGIANTTNGQGGDQFIIPFDVRLNGQGSVSLAKQLPPSSRSQTTARSSEGPNSTRDISGSVQAYSLHQVPEKEVVEDSPPGYFSNRNSVL